MRKSLKGEMGSSGVRWMGEIPKGWNVIRFKFMHGPANVGCSIDKNYWSNDAEDIPFYTAGIQHIYTNNKKFPIEKYTRQNDLLLSRNGTPYVYLPVEGAAYTDHIIRVGISPLYDRRFVRYCLQQSIALSVVDTVSLPTWSVSIWNRQYLPLVSLTEQHAIADYLDERCAKIDAIIAESKKSIEEYKELKQAVIYEAVTKGLDKNAEIKDVSEWFEACPVSWKCEPIKALYELRNERNYRPLNEVNLISLYTDKGVVQHDDLEKTVGNKASNADGYKIVYPNDIIVNIILCWMGAIGRSDYYGVTSPAYDVYRPIDSKLIDSRYYHYLFRTDRFAGKCYTVGHGIMMMRWRTYSTEFRRIKVPVPSLEKQRQIADYLDERCSEIDSLISEKQSLVSDLESYKKSLIYEVVTGKRRVV